MIHQFQVPDSEVRDFRIGHSDNARISYSPKSHELVLDYTGACQKFRVSPGDKLLINCEKQTPEITVMEPPKNPLSRVAWEHYFFRKKRFFSFDELQEHALQETALDDKGTEIPACSLYRALSKKCAIAYKLLGVYRFQKPYGWWADPHCPPNDLEELILHTKEVDSVDSRVIVFVP